MQWQAVREQYPDQWILVEVMEGHEATTEYVIEEVTIVEACKDAFYDGMEKYKQLHQEHPQRAFIMLHTSQAKPYVGIMEHVGYRIAD